MLADDDDEKKMMVIVDSLVTIKVILKRTSLLARKHETSSPSHAAKKYAIESIDVHCSHFSNEKPEIDNVNLVEKKTKSLASFVVSCKGLVDEKEVRAIFGSLRSMNF